MELFLWEHKRLWRRKSSRISVFLCLLYVFVFGCVLSYQWFAFGSSPEYGNGSFDNRFDGYSNIRASQQYARKFGGELTDEALQEIIRDYQAVLASGHREAVDRTNWQEISSWLGTLYPELEKEDQRGLHLMMDYVDPEALTGFYERRQEALENFLDISGQTGREREYLLKMNEKVKIPFQYGWMEGWSMVLGSILPDLGMVLALFLAISLSPVFAGEWQDKTSALILTTKNGWKKAARAKILSALAFAAKFFAMIFAGSVGAQLFFLGTEGWDMPIQNIKLIAVAPLNLLQAEIFGYAFGFLGVIGFAGLMMLLSACAKSNFTALLLGLSAVYLPMMISEYLPFWAQKALDLLPLVGSSADIFRTTTFCIFGNYIWSPYLLLIVPVMIGLACVPFAVKKWAGRTKV